MPLTQITYTLPGTGGLNTDSPTWAVQPNQAVVLKDAVSYNGVLTQRRGWTYRVTDTVAKDSTGSGEKAVSTKPMDSFSERVFVKAKRNGAVATQGANLWVRDDVSNTSDASLKPWRKFLHKHVEYAGNTGVTTPGGGYRPSDGTVIGNTIQDQTVSSSAVALKRTARYLPRTYYNDELIFCASDGFYPALRYAGAYNAGSDFAYMVWSGTTGALNNVFNTGNNAAAARLAINGTFTGGTYWTPVTENSASASFRIYTASSGYWDIPGFKANANTSQPTSMETYPFGCVWGGCEIYNEGTVSIGASGALTFSGTNIDADSLITVNNSPFRMMADTLIVEREKNTSWTMHPLVSYTNPTTAFTGASVAQTTAPCGFSIGRRMGVRDIATHGGVLFGAGSVNKPARVWYAEDGWTPSMPPELGQPYYEYDASKFYESRAGKFRYVDVPAEDTNEIVAIVTSDSPLLVLKSNAVYGIFGAYPNYTQSLITAGAGCIDVRSAISVDGYGTFWAGPSGIYSYKRGKVTDLTSDRVNREWVRRIKAYNTATDTDNSVACGVASGHLIVSASVGTTTKDEWTWVCNLATGAWSELTNVNSRFFHTVFTNAGIEATLATLGATNVSYRPINIQPTMNMLGTAKDDDGYSPALIMETGSAMDGDKTPGRQSRLTDVDVDSVVQDTGTPTTPTRVDVTTISTSGIDQSPSSISQSVGYVSAASDAYTHRANFYAGLAGRENRIRLSVSQLAASNQTIQIHELNLQVRVRKPSL